MAGVREPCWHWRVEKALGDRCVEQAEIALCEAGRGGGITRSRKHES
jgi:hypothetical protein